MRVLIIFLLLIILGFIGWKIAERYEIAPPIEEVIAPPEQEPVAEPLDDAPKTSLPSFDIVRIDRTGDAVIAGRAAPSAEVSVFANDEPLATQRAGSDGDWAIVTETPLDAGTVELTLEMKTTDGLVVRSEETVVIYVPERPTDKPLILRTTPGGATEILQDTRDPDPALGPLSLTTIDYEDSGSVIFSGRAEPGRAVILSANGQPVGRTVADQAGQWTLSATMTPGRYTLRVTQLDEEGRPKYVIELPFERAAPGDIELREGRVVVQPGNSLWRIARRVYGSGFQYTVIYEANADQIRDPDLIYPGQIFDLPEEQEDDQETESDSN
ncbi:MAG: LysM peptidoglycan-binding domain-containing protein [Pseudomonadota bacterium]